MSKNVKYGAVNETHTAFVCQICGVHARKLKDLRHKKDCSERKKRVRKPKAK